MKQAARLGIDVGGVIIGADNDTTMFTKNYLEAKPVDGSFEAIAILRERFLGELVIISKAGPEMEKKTLEWLAHKQFWQAIGMSCRYAPGKFYTDFNLFFVRERADKARVCKRLSVTHFIDDRTDVLVHLQHVVRHRYLFGAHEIAYSAGRRDHRAPVALRDWSAALLKVKP